MERLFRLGQLPVTEHACYAALLIRNKRHPEALIRGKKDEAP